MATQKLRHKIKFAWEKAIWNTREKKCISLKLVQPKKNNQTQIFGLNAWENAHKTKLKHFFR